MGILTDIDETINQADAWMLKQEFDSYRKETDDKILELKAMIKTLMNNNSCLDSFVKYLEYEIFELKKDVYK